MSVPGSSRGGPTTAPPRSSSGTDLRTKGRRRTVPHRRSVEARRHVRDPARASVTIGTLAQQWLESKVNLKASTRARYTVAFDDHVLPRWRDVTLAQVEHEAVQGWIAQLVTDGAAAASVRKVHGVLAAVLDHAVKTRRLSSNPARGVTLPPPRLGQEAVPHPRPGRDHGHGRRHAPGRPSAPLHRRRPPAVPARRARARLLRSPLV
ncbi:phage integrase central domain-containing protein [Jatrophihabitans fulvus]